jgi:hypothetical protein
MVNRGFKSLALWIDFLTVLYRSLEKKEGRQLIPSLEVDIIESSLTASEKVAYRIFIQKARNAKTHKEIEELICTAKRIIPLKMKKVPKDELRRIFLLIKAGLAVKKAEERSKDTV